MKVLVFFSVGYVIFLFLPYVICLAADPRRFCLSLWLSDAATLNLLQAISMPPLAVILGDKRGVGAASFVDTCYSALL